ncbi:hypothetical protein F503_06323 [Ophiostoma piceae UAMH 11346]|uniref:Uncharacterized protein n=1 Tax=Ophiostoma piceae (strain UAMH 11346) TaxID=1262450 RepID=S3BU55_OPHP1|nr:hypothetical protein F503_06323 [Ophiostoma piceae UAMH 11346]
MATAASTVQQLISMHPTNPVNDTNMQSESKKNWTHLYPPITTLRVHTYVQADGSVIADFDSALLPYDTDEDLRLGEEAFPPNDRSYRLYSEADGITWFTSEIDSVVLAAFKRFPGVIHQSHHPPKLGSGSSAKVADTAYVVNFDGLVTSLAVGEFKRNLVHARQWQNNDLGPSQASFSRELRGYAHMYECPQVFCFDHQHLLMLQFRANSVDAIRHTNDVDCWVLPRENPGGTPFRYALYRLLVQGFRRFQGLHRTNVHLNGLAAETVDLFTGQPRWRINGTLTRQPFGYTRALDRNTGAFYWLDEHGNVLMDQQGNFIWDTTRLWGGA